MSNMSYCRFENTTDDLYDCLDHINDDDLSSSEKKYRECLVDLCKKIVREYDDRCKKIVREYDDLCKKIVREYDH